MPVVKTEPVIENLKLRDFFKDDIYSVPSFQRDYAWGKSEAKDLIADLIEWATDDDRTPYYLMGQVVVVRDEETSFFQIVDGQQRITTLFLVLLSVDQLLSIMNFRPTGVQESLLQSQLTSSIVVEIHDGEPIARIRLSDSNSVSTDLNQNFLVNLISDSMELPEVLGLTQTNLLANIKKIKSELTDQFNSETELFGFLEKIMTGVYLSRLEVESVPQALDIFEKLNNRGLNLSSADLLKNLLFQKSQVDDYHQVSSIWSGAAQTIFSIKPKRASTMEFLVKAMIAGETGRSIPTAKVYREWGEIFRDNSERVDSFKNEIQIKARALVFLSNKKTPDGQNSDTLQGAHFFGAVQHFTVLLAGSHLNLESFKELARIVDDRTVLSIISRERSQDFERMIPEWSQAIQILPAAASISDVHGASARAMRDVNMLIEQAKINFSRLQYSRPHEQDQIRYVLTRVSIKVESLARHTVESLWKRGLLERENGQRPDKPFDIEHVAPQSGGSSSDAFDFDWRQGIGNLVLMHYSDNRAAGANNPGDKVGHYNSSELLLTRLLCDSSDLGVLNQRIKRIVEKFQANRSWNLANWSSECARNRESLYWELLETDFRTSLQVVVDE
jgi:hypothetical protein